MCGRKKMKEYLLNIYSDLLNLFFLGFAVPYRRNRATFVVLCLASVLLLPSCTSLLQEDVVSYEAHQRAIEAGIIAEVEVRPDRAFRGQTAQVVVGDIISDQDSVRIGFDTSQLRELHFSREEVRLTEILVSLDQEVSKGDVLAIGEFDTRELEEELEILRLSIELVEQGLERDRGQHEDLLAQMGRDLDLMTDEHERYTQEQRIVRQELLMERDISQQESRLEAYNEQRDELYALLEGDKIIAPFDGVIVTVRDTDRTGFVVTNEDVIIRMIDPHRMQFVATDHIDLVRVGDVFPAVMGRDEFEFEVQVVSDPITTDTREEVYTFVLQPVDREGFWNSFFESGMTYSVLRTISITGFPTRHEIRGVLTIPVEALHDYDRRFYVWVYEDGEIRRRFIDVGFRDEEHVQVLSGLEEGQWVVR